MAEHCVDINSVTTGNDKPQKPLKANKRARLVRHIEKHPRLSPGQKEQALYFLLSPSYSKDGYAIAKRYCQLCLNPKYTTRGTAWHGEKMKDKHPGLWI